MWAVSGWAADELASIGEAIEIGIASRRADGSLRPIVTIWAVRVGDAVYVRSAYGWDNPWFQRALAAGEGRIRGPGFERDAGFEQPEPELAGAVSDAYRAKYGRWSPGVVKTVLSAEAERATLRVVPR